MSQRSQSRWRKYSRRTLAALSLGVLLIAGCFPIGVDTHPIPPPLLRPRPDLFAVPKGAKAPEVIRSSSSHDVAVFSVDSTIPGRRDPLRVHLYRRDEEAPTIVVLPMMGGRYLVSRYLADQIYDAGFSILRLERRAPLVEREGGLTSAREAFRGAVIDVRRALDWLESCEGINRDEIGLVGISAGGIIGSLASGVDERIDSAAFMLAGGNLLEMVLHSDEAGLGRLKTATLKSRPLLRGVFDELMPEFLSSLDPLAYAGRLPPKRILLIGAAFDSVIPRRCTLALWEAWKRPRLLELPAGHYTAALFLPLVLPELVAHFEGTFGR